MINFELKKWVRPRMWDMKPYSSARDEFSGVATAHIDANESPYNAELPHLDASKQVLINRYPDPLQTKLKNSISEVCGIAVETIFLGNGSDEAIDLLMRLACEPNESEILIAPPTYGMYAVSADINSVAVREVPLLSNFQLNVPEILRQIQPQTKIIFLCSPNNPTGNLMHEADLLTIITNFSGVVVIDEAYIDFSSRQSWAGKVLEFPNLVILRTFSKAWGLAGARLGMAIASPAIISFLNKIKPPYNINTLTQAYVLEILNIPEAYIAKKNLILENKEMLIKQLLKHPRIEHIYPSDANFILVKVTDANNLYHHLLEKGVVVRNRSQVQMCEGCLRISIGNPHEIAQLLNAMA